METLDFFSMQELNKMIEGIDNDARIIITEGYETCRGTVCVSGNYCVITVNLDKAHGFQMTEHTLLYENKVIIIQKMWMGASLCIMLERFN